MTDEEMLRQTWKDARSSIEEDKPFSQTKISMYITGALVVGLVGVAYMAYSTMGSIAEIQLILEGANKP